MPKTSSAHIQDHFADLTDPRRRPVVYPLINIVTIAVCAVICGADDFVAIAEFGRAKRKFLERFLDLSAGIPSHDRFNAIFRAIKPAEFEKSLLRWITALHEVTDGQVVAMDGKHMSMHTAVTRCGSTMSARFPKTCPTKGVGTNCGPSAWPSTTRSGMADSASSIATTF